MQTKNSISTFIWFLAAITFTVSIGIPKGFNVSISVIFLCSLAMSLLKLPVYQQDKTDQTLIWVFFAFGLSMIVFSLCDHFDINGLDKPSRFIFAIPVILLLLRCKGPKEWLWYGIVIGALLAFGLALYERVVEGVARANGAEHPIMFGDTGMMLGLLSLAGAAYFYAKKSPVWVCIALIGCVSGVGTSVLSGSRGGWIALPLVSSFILWECRALIGKKCLLALCAIALSCAAIAVSVPQTGIQNRIDKAVSNIVQYQAGENSATSVGLRFDMWKAALYMFQQSPIFGVGQSRVQPIKQQLAQLGEISPKAVPYEHAHNEYLQALSTRGLLGLIFLLAIYLVPLRLFLRKLEQHKNNWTIRTYAIAGAIVPMCYMDFALTQTMFMHNIGVMMFAFPIAFFWAAVRWAERDSEVTAVHQSNAEFVSHEQASLQVS